MYHAIFQMRAVQCFIHEAPGPLKLLTDSHTKLFFTFTTKTLSANPDITTLTDTRLSSSQRGGQKTASSLMPAKELMFDKEGSEKQN